MILIIDSQRFFWQARRGNECFKTSQLEEACQQTGTTVACADGSTQRAQHGLIREYTLNDMGTPNMIQGVFLNYAMSGSLGMKRQAIAFYTAAVDALEKAQGFLACQASW